jgi:hypothetical protein
MVSILLILNSKKFLLHDHHRQRQRTPGEPADNACCKKNAIKGDKYPELPIKMYYFCAIITREA